jgi:hypothetical protein
VSVETLVRWLSPDAEAHYNWLSAELASANEKFRADIAPYVERLPSEELARRVSRHIASLEPMKREMFQLRLRFTTFALIVRKEDAAKPA